MTHSSTQQKLDETGSSQFADVSENFANALRNNQIDDFSAESPYAACLFPLLNALGWKNIARELIEALPHFAKELDLIDLRNILVNLGYESSPHPTQLNQLQAELYPSIFISNTDDVFVLVKKNGQQISYFDAQKEQAITAPIDKS